MTFQKGHHGFQKGNKLGFQEGKSGNPNGQPIKKRDNVTRLVNAMKRIEKEKDEDGKRRGSLIDHFVRRAYYDDDILNSLMRKVLPDKQIGEEVSRKEGNAEQGFIVIPQKKEIGEPVSYDTEVPGEDEYKKLLKINDNNDGEDKE